MLCCCVTRSAWKRSALCSKIYYLDQPLNSNSVSLTHNTYFRLANGTYSQLKSSWLPGPKSKNQKRRPLTINQNEEVDDSCKS